jgi:pimeloyl-ACP methyl ester carboxylesterase
VGFSLGGLIVQAYTLAHPQKVTALAILNSAHARTKEQRASIMQRVQQAEASGPAATIDAALQRWFTDDFATRNPRVLNQVRTWVTGNDAAVYPALYRLLADADIGLETSIAGIGCPVLVLTGEEDAGNSPQMAQRMATIMPDARLAILPGLRHMALAEDPAAVNDLLIPFLRDTLQA